MEWMLPLNLTYTRVSNFGQNLSYKMTVRLIRGVTYTRVYTVIYEPSLVHIRNWTHSNVFLDLTPVWKLEKEMSGFLRILVSECLVIASPLYYSLIPTFFRSSYIPEQAYGNSKAAQILMTLYLNSMVHSYLFKCLRRNMNHFDWFCNSQGWDSLTLKLCCHWHFSNKNSLSRKNFLSWTWWISAQANRQDILWGHP